MFGPADIVDAVNRIRGPFNVSTPAMLAAVAAIEDTAHQQMSKAHTEKWRNWLTEEIGKLGLKVTPSVANFILIHFPLDKGKTSAEADAFLTKRGLVLRALNNYGLPHALRMTIGTEEANRLVLDGLRDFMALQVNAAPLFKKIALIGFGLIGGSIARAARAQGLAGEIVTTARSAKTRARVAELGIVDRVVESNAEAVEGRRSRHPVHPGRRLRRRSRRRSRLISSRARSCPMSARSRARWCARWRRICRTACISCRRIRSPAPSIPAPIPASPNCSSTAGASSRRRKAPIRTRSRGCARSGPRSAPRSRS